MHLLHGPPVKFTIAAELLGENPISANQQLIIATAVPNTIGTQLIFKTVARGPFDFV